MGLYKWIGIIHNEYMITLKFKNLHVRKVCKHKLG